MKKLFFVIMLSVMITALFTETAHLCGLNFTFRAYLDKHFWQPIVKYEDSLAKAKAKKQRKKDAPIVKEKTGQAFAGYSTRPASEILQKVRKAYIAEDYDKAKRELHTAQNKKLSEKEEDELRLIDAKLDLRMAEKKDPCDRTLLVRSRAKLTTFLKTAQDPFWKSEARGWLARVELLLGNQAKAMKIYLDELEQETTAFSRASLISSLHMIFPYNGSSADLADHLEEYFDTPAHALFVVYLVTNPVQSNEAQRARTAGIARKVINSLQRHPELFKGTELSDRLALALMRASIYMGDTRTALTYARKISRTSRMAKTPEFIWTVGACHFLQREYEKAETPLLKVIRSKEANLWEVHRAAQGLIGVYQQLNRPVDQLRSAFLYEKTDDAIPPEPAEIERYMDLSGQAGSGWLLDLPYLLDVQLTDEALQEYLEHFEKEAKQIKYPRCCKRQRTAFQTVQYALAVRLARQEQYDEAASIYESLNARPRAKRMRYLADLYAKATDETLPAGEHQEARYQYAVFLEEHSTQVFYNDMIWKGFQTTAFLRGDRPGSQGFTRDERDRLLKMERKIQDEQDERWRAYRILSEIMEQAGYSELGRKAALKAIRCLAMINTDRFGRSEEIDQGKVKLKVWLREYRKQNTKDSQD
jgi:hypothetical protein